jgi:hypothetical protein
MRFVEVECAQRGSPSSRNGCGKITVPVGLSGQSCLTLRQIGVILEKFHAGGWTAPITPTYCPDERILSMDRAIERQSVWQHSGRSIGRFVGLSASFALRSPVFCC